MKDDSMYSFTAWLISRMRHIALALLLVVGLASLWSTHTEGFWQSLRSFRSDEVLEHMLPSARLSSIPFDDIVALYKPLLLPVTAPKFKIGSESYAIEGDMIWEQPLGKRICIVDIDDRAFDGENQMFGSTPFSWSSFSPNNGGILAHYLYAKIHGYDYKFIHTPAFDDRDAFWTKPPAVSDTLHNYDFVVSIDADAQFNHPQIPFEWLLNRWNVTRSTHLTMALDPPDKPNYDGRGRLVDNAGFVVAQNTRRAHEILRAWSDCPEERGEAYKDCARFKRGWPAEQGAFANYVRYVYNEPGDLNELPCDEANGSADHVMEDPPTSEFAHSCQGRFIEHHTLTKALVKRNIERVHADLLVPRIFDSWFKHKAKEERVYHELGEILMKRVFEQFMAEKSETVVQRTTNDFRSL